MEHLGENYKKKALPQSLVTRVLRRQQRLLYEHFERLLAPQPDWRVLNLGVDTSVDDASGYFFTYCYPHKAQITAAGIEPPRAFSRHFPGVTYRQTSRTDEHLPFGDEEYDVVFCNAVLEHVGDREAQRRFLSEILRVGKRAFVTTPNRWYPVELHTTLPLLHFLPAPAYRRVNKALGFDFFADEENLNLLDKKSLWAMVPSDCRARAQIHSHRFLGFVSNLLLVVREY